ncbi:hypothetical protein [Streptomyces chryseus]|uniref:hypothetical protein n=1 Tax=Streptomyces chryseus TaxID=68186 RepID=UPI0019CA85F8|nr:hypothetical protein [Streptomyces chryseus]GGX12671.1 hypothetical protein GCM10010353_30140 [Streptomyces chryseus]
MSQQYPYPPQQPFQPPQAPRKSWAARNPAATVLIVLGGVVGAFFVFVVVIGLAIGGSSSDGGKPSEAVAAESSTPLKKPVREPAEKADEKPAEKPKPKSVPRKLSQADQFKAFVAKSGLAGEKQAVKHVTKVQGADEQNDILDTAEIHTDFSGGFMSPDHGKAKLIASAFADWKDSKNGLVSVHGKDGKLIANGNY